MLSRFMYPALNKLRAGNAPAPTQDAIGRRVLRVDEERHNIGDQPAQQPGGMPQVRGPQHMVPYLLEAAAKLGIPAQQATSPGIMQRIAALGTVPQQMAGQLGSSDPKQQAMAILQRGKPRA